jgi:hypothetical protein
VSGNRFRNVDLTGRAVRFHKRRRIHGIAPDVEAETTIANDAGNDRPREPSLDTRASRMGGLRNERQSANERVKRVTGETYSLEMNRSHESTPAFDFAVTRVGRMVRAPAPAHYRVWLHAARLCETRTRA